MLFVFTFLFSNLKMGSEKDVYVYIYDLSANLAPIVSTSLLGTSLKGIWHSSIVVYGREIDYGPQGIENRDVAKERNIILIGNAEPVRKIHLGRTSYSYSTIKDFLFCLGASEFKPEHYKLWTHNCNIFANRLSKELVNEGIPEYVLQLPNDITKSVFKKVFEFSIDSMIQNGNNNLILPAIKEILNQHLTPHLENTTSFM